MTFGDLFAGIGGFHLGLERAGHECKWACEIDPFCRKVYLKHWPDTSPFYEDICDVQDPPYVDMLCGGFPCQDLSLAGKQSGIDGERSGLWSEFARLIRAIQPRVVFVENVPGLLIHGMGRVLGDLAALGYDAEWQVLPATSVGGNHRRDRVWIIAYSKRSSVFEHVGQCGISLPWGENQKVGCLDRVMFELDPGEMAPSKWQIEGQDNSRPLFVRDDDGIPNRVDRLKSLGNAVVPQVVEWIGRRLYENKS